jgi:midasin (ATPase involved in ribosome maturation)
VRINNHEHTDIQEYLGSYIADETGKLVFQEGALVQAVREGHWIVLDELNLAPSDVLEALNRLLDDNRELFIPETQQVVAPHPNFMLFATQNPPGSYGGRKVLSRAFRNRFIELHFEDIPVAELETILKDRCKVPSSLSKKLIAVMKELQQHRQGTQVFAGKHGFITFRDLFRWAERYRQLNDVPTSVVVDHNQILANDGFMLLAERTRTEDERVVVKRVLEKHFGKTIDTQSLYNCDAHPLYLRMLVMIQEAREDPTHPIFPYIHVVWTSQMKRLFCLVARCLEVKEPVLLVGSTGCGKTTVCQILSVLLQQNLHILNCHQNTETADFLGGLRPVRSHTDEPDASESLPTSESLPSSSSPKIFEWCDGPLITSMVRGDMFLIDEVSLADDSVLERINSVLEPSRRLLLAEKGGKSIEATVAHESFRILATMNPGGDFGKKELSPALR